MRKIFPLTLIALFFLGFTPLSLAEGDPGAPGLYIDFDIDTCEENADGTDAYDSYFWCSGGICFIDLLTCDPLDPKAKYRFHFDTTAPFFDDMGEGECYTTSDDTLMYRPGPDKLTGPEVSEYVIDATSMWFIIPYASLGVGFGDYVAAWIDIHKQGIQDRLPDTDDADDCSKPQNASEVMEICVGGVCN